MQSYISITILLFFIVACKTESNEQSEQILIDALDSTADPLPDRSNEDILGNIIDCVPSVDSVLNLPFEDKIDKIQVVSYFDTRTEKYGNSLDDTIIEIEIDGRIGFNDFNETLTLRTEEKNELYALIKAYEKPHGYSAISDCYAPHHCVHFLDEDSNLLGYLEICLICNAASVSHSELQLYCGKQFESFRSFLSKIGIKAHIERL